MSSRRPTFEDLAWNMLEMYLGILGGDWLEELRHADSAMGRRIRLMVDVTTGQVQRGSMQVTDAILFYETLLECSALRSATLAEGTVFDAPILGDPTLLLETGGRWGKLAQRDEALADWFFQLMVQAWLSSQGYGRMVDLRRDSRFRGNSKVCDFLVSDDRGQAELVECKRVHPAEPVAGDPLDATLRKVADRAPLAAQQLVDTSEVLERTGCQVTCRHAMFDISAYHLSPREVQLKTRHAVVTGYSGDEVQMVVEEIRASPPPDIDKLTFCWRNLVSIEGRPLAIVQNASPVIMREEAGSVFEYGGWSVEGYPMGNSEYRELRVASVARGLAWIETTYNMLSSPETFLSVGPVQERQ